MPQRHAFAKAEVARSNQQSWSSLPSSYVNRLIWRASGLLFRVFPLLDFELDRAPTMATHGISLVQSCSGHLKCESDAGLLRRGLLKSRDVKEPTGQHHLATAQL
mmetsp:Transcript_139019/g.443567  ORF Transcript_139019/g.443567 Transcript_139019/m.443567 type:complete len:105 (+) Transcript_139019:1603-1917(+)